MDKQIPNIEVQADKIIVEDILSKEDLTHYNLSQLEVPTGYFESFPEKVLGQINASKKNNKSKIHFIHGFGKLAIAAALLFVIASTFIFINDRTKSNTELATINLVDVPNEEIESYINSNEFIAEIDWQTEINKVSDNIEDPQNISTKN